MSEAENERRRNARVVAAMFACVAIGFVAYGLSNRHWAVILVMSIAAVANVYGAIRLIRK